MEKREHLLIYGSVGAGKTHLAQAIGHETCRRGYSVLFVKSVKMLRQLFASRADQSWERQVKKYLRPDLLIIDDFGLTALTPIQAEDIYEIVTERHSKSSIIVTSNGPPQDWVALFPDPVMANSALDRLSHHGHHIMIDGGESYRRRLSPKTRQ
ncbi:MAG: Chromosomal replication initiator protein DnaA [Syntrophorhabdus sp. PtaU1.Bin153]|nr:MAG: Chromosomal replication initiator protein DnaA [Syntrophorhabdus sp. PtaU1.Bin153]